MRKILIFLSIIFIIWGGIFIFNKFFNYTKEKVEFEGCSIKLTRFLIPKGFHCGDLQKFRNYNEHVEMIHCLCENYQGVKLLQILDNYLNTYAPDQKERMIEDAGDYKDYWMDRNITKSLNLKKWREYYGYNPFEKPKICIIKRIACM